MFGARVIWLTTRVHACLRNYFLRKDFHRRDDKMISSYSYWQFLLLLLPPPGELYD